MTDILYVVILIIDIIVIRDIVRKLREDVPRLLWVIAVVVLPVLGALLWWQVQYNAPRQKRLEREQRRLHRQKRG